MKVNCAAIGWACLQASNQPQWNKIYRRLCFAQSRLTDFEVKQMSEDIALVSVSRVRYKTDGSELEQLGETYTFRKTENDWKIVAAMVHDPDTVLRLC